MSEQEFILECKENILAGITISTNDIKKLINVSEQNLKILAESANQITREFNGPAIDVEQLYNIKKNACSEDCTFCAQSAFFDTDIDTYKLPPAKEIINAAKKAKDQGAQSYCLVAAWRAPSQKDFENICDTIQQINTKVGIPIECSLGFLTDKQAKHLKLLKVKRYNHNLETARSKFPEICTTHTYQDRINTLMIARNAGLELCTGGIIGMGETRDQRLELALELATLKPEEVTINILVPVQGTPLELETRLPNHELIRMFSIVRFALPESIIKISGGREVNTDDKGQQLLQSGANGIITAGYLTMDGTEPQEDMQLVQKIGGLEV